MITEPIRLEEISSVISLEEIPKEILVSNPRGRNLVIKPEESGWCGTQVFTSECLPDSILYELLGLIKFPDGSVYPKYRANVVTETKLHLGGKIGYENGISVINKVAWWLTWQEKMLEAKSIKESDLNFFDYEKEKLSSYWLSSPGVYECSSYVYFGPGVVGIDGSVGLSGVFYVFPWTSVNIYDSAAVRPTMILTSKVKIDQPEFPWVEL